MLETIRIQNFRSLKDVTLDLKKINLLIGANNSGKSNFLRALKFFGEFVSGNKPNRNEVARSVFSHNESLEVGFTLLVEDEFYKCVFFSLPTRNEVLFNEIIGCSSSYSKESILLQPIEKVFREKFDKSKEKYIANFRSLSHYGYNENKVSDVDYLTNRISKIANDDKFYSRGFRYISYLHEMGEAEYKTDYFSENSIFDDSSREFHLDLDLKIILQKLKIYNPDPNKIVLPNTLSGDTEINEDASNLVSVFDSIRDRYPEAIDDINEAIHTCLPEFKGLRFEFIKEPNGKSMKKVGFG